VFERLRDEHGVTGGYTILKDYVREGAAVIAALIARLAGSHAALGLARFGAVALAVLLFLAALRRPAGRVGRLAERLDRIDKANDAQHTGLAWRVSDGWSLGAADDGRNGRNSLAIGGDAKAGMV